MGVLTRLSAVGLVVFSTAWATVGSTFAQSAFGPAGPILDMSATTLVVALVEDPDFPPLEERLVQKAIRSAQAEFRTRFATEPPRMVVRYRFSIERFLALYAVAKDPRCRDLFAARYTGHGPEELKPFQGVAERFMRKWNVKAIKGFVPDDAARIRTHADVYDLYVERYTEAVAKLKGLKTPADTPLVEPDRKTVRSLVAWLCALKRQTDYDVILTNTFILADVMTEPHPHAVFGKAKIGGLALPSPSRPALGGQVLLATTFGIDTDIPHLSELNGVPATVDERAEILGAYLLAHEIAHAVFSIPDVFDHPLGCLMTSRPGASYREGLAELKAYPRPCPRCRPYVQSKSKYVEARLALIDGEPGAAARKARRAISLLPKHVHGGRKPKLAAMSQLVAAAYSAQGKKRLAKRYADLAARLAPAQTPKAPQRSRPTVPIQRTVKPTRTATTVRSSR